MRKLKLEELNRLSTEEFKNSDKKPVIVVLDNIRSMHNVGSVFRSADAFLVEKIFLCGYTPTPPHRDIRKTAIGAEETVDWEYKKEILPLLEQLKATGARLIAIEQAHESISLKELNISPAHSTVFIFGNEVEGVQDAVLSCCDLAVEIPQFGTKHSLNISVAAGIVLYQTTS